MKNSYGDDIFEHVQIIGNKISLCNFIKKIFSVLLKTNIQHPWIWMCMSVLLTKTYHWGSALERVYMVRFCRLKNETVLWLTICFIYCRLSMSWIDASSLFCDHQLTSLLKANYNQLSTEPEEVVQVLDFLHLGYTLTSTLFLHISFASWLLPPFPKLTFLKWNIP